MHHHDVPAERSHARHGGLLVGAAALVAVLWASLPAAAAVYPQQPAASGTLLCVAGSGISCFARPGMEKRWQVLDQTRMFAPVIAGDTVIAGGSRGLYALRAANGMSRWHWPGGGEVFSPMVDAGVAYATDRAGRVAAIDLDSGRLHWQRRLGGWLYTPALAGDRIVTGGQDGVLYALDRATGATAWTRELGQELVFHPVAVDGGVVVTTFDGAITRFDAGGRRQWQVRDATPAFSPRVAGGLLVYGGMDGVLRARDAATGELIWRVALSGKLAIPAAVQAGMVAAVNPDGALVLVEAASGAVAWRGAVPGTPIGAPLPLGPGAWRIFQHQSGIISWVNVSCTRSACRVSPVHPAVQ